MIPLREMISSALVGIAAFFFVAIAAGVIVYLVYYFAEQRSKKDKGTTVPDDTSGAIDPSAGYEFMVHNGESGRRNVERKRSYDLYSPDSNGSKVLDYNSKDDSRFRGHDIQITELPEPEEEKIDASWVELDVTREFKEIIKEIKRKKLNCYEILDVPENAKPQEIKKAYRKAASYYHPDRGPGAAGLDNEEVGRKIREINYAKDMLLNPTMRSFHDQILRDRRRD